MNIAHLTRSLLAIFALGVGCVSPAVFAQTNPLLEVNGRLTNGWFTMAIRGGGWVYSVERSSDLLKWEEISLIMRSTEYKSPAHPFVDTSTGSGERRYYRVQASWFTGTNVWKNQVFHGQEPFLFGDELWTQTKIDWVKFAIPKEEPGRVYYQDSGKYEFHYDFAVAELPQFAGMSRAEFDAVSLYTNDQQVVLGTLLYAPWPHENEVGVQFVGVDPFSAEQIVEWIELVRVSIVGNAPIKLVYIPTLEQRPTAERNPEFLEARGIELGSIAEWTGGANCYSGGWAMGTLKYVPSEEIELAYALGELRPEDILLTDAVPAELPYVSGLLTLEPTTPNSHVAILALQYGIPFGWLDTAEAQAKALAATGKDVIVSPESFFRRCNFQVIDISGMEAEVRSEIAALKRTATAQITPKERYGSYFASTDELVPEDIKYFGGKAANFGFLRRAIPTTSPQAIAISFDLWDEFMEQVLPTGKRLGEEIESRLSQHNYPPSVAALKADLAQIRGMITGWTQFTEAQEEAIAGVLLGNFDPQRKIRFRSSTNVEDSENFTGAGLYDSYSGCLADDLDGDAFGPSSCERDEKNERGVFRAIRKVYASFYNDNAVLERMRHGINEEEVGMAILVHYSTPDEIEMANGVATLGYPSPGIKLVTQKGALSVTNPDPENSALPEILERYEAKQWSSLMPVGAYVLDHPEEYSSLFDLLGAVSQEFREYYKKTNYILDFEYKKVAPGDLLVKQVREIRLPKEEIPSAPYLINEAQEWWVYQGDHGDVFANHRLKSRFWLSTRNLKLVESNLTSSIFDEISFEYVNEGTIRRRGGAVSGLPNAEYRVEIPHSSQAIVTSSWTPSEHPAERLALQLPVPLRIRNEESSFFTLRNSYSIELLATYSTPQIGRNGAREFGLVTNETVRLVPCTSLSEKNVLVKREVEKNGVRVSTQFYWPEAPPPEAIPPKTMHLSGWEKTVISGLTSEPIVLRGYYSQTNRPAHHNFGGEFLFEPRLEEGIAEEILAELEAKNIRAIYVLVDDENEILLLGFDEELRPVGNGG